MEYIVALVFIIYGVLVIFGVRELNRWLNDK